MTNKPTIKKIDFNSPADEVLEKAAQTLSTGGIVVAPTETRYGLLARADRVTDVENIYRIKKRSLYKPMAMFVDRLEFVMYYAELSPVIQRISRLLLPGPLTLVLKALPYSNNPLVRDNKIGIRISSSKVIAGILERINFPLTATSANISGQGEMSSIEKIAETFNCDVSLYLDSGELFGLTSTVLDCTGKELSILRQGAIGDEVIFAACGDEMNE